MRPRPTGEPAVRAGGALQGSLQPARADDRLAHDWQLLQVHADGTPFTSWPWVGTWLAQLPADLDVRVFRATQDDQLIGIGLLVRGGRRGLRDMLGTPWHLHQTGDDAIDEITPEYGGLLLRKGHEVEGYRALLACLPGQVGQLHISASAHAGAINAARGTTGPAVRMPRQQSCYFVDLQMIRDHDDDYIGVLGRNTRATLRRTRRAYEELGSLHVDIPASTGEALDWLAQLRIAHQHYWQGRGQQGAFASAFFGAFHERLVTDHHDSGFAQLLRIRAGDAVVGWLYNLVWQKQAYFYNAGLNYGLLERHDRPGYLAHLLAVEHYLAEAIDKYDFLAGDGDYKRAMSTHVRNLHWLDVRCGHWQPALERILRKAARRATLPPLPSHAHSMPTRVRN